MTAQTKKNRVVLAEPVRFKFIWKEVASFLEIDYGIGFVSKHDIAFVLIWKSPFKRVEFCYDALNDVHVLGYALRKKFFRFNLLKPSIKSFQLGSQAVLINDKYPTLDNLEGISYEFWCVDNRLDSKKISTFKRYIEEFPEYFI